MARVNFDLQYYNEADNPIFAGTDRQVRFAYHGGAANGVTGIPLTGEPFWRIYNVLDAPGAYVAMTQTSLSEYLEVLTVPVAGTYAIDFKDDRGERTIVHFRVYAKAEVCIYPAVPYSLYAMRVEDSRVRFLGAPTNGFNQVKVNSSSYKSTNSGPEGAIFTNSELGLLGATDVIDTVTYRNDVELVCQLLTFSEVFIGDFESAPLEASYVKTNCTAAGANDGTITLTVDGGSGNYSFLWADGPVTQNRLNLAPGTYSVTITDLTTAEVVELNDIVVSDPAPEPLPTGAILEFPVLNSMHFVVNPIDPAVSQQTLDNTLFADQVFPGFSQVCYYDKRCQTDTPAVVQFFSDFGAHLVELIDKITGEVVKTFSVSLVEENIGIAEDFGISIRNHIDNPGQSRVYFAVGALPILLEVGDVFEVLNNLEGFDGNYEIVNIVTDSLLGYQYLVINLNYTGAGTSSAATGRFFSNNEDYNVYETTINLLDVPIGKYHVKVSGLNDGGMVGKYGQSEPIDLKVAHADTNLIEYRNVDNGYGDIVWTTGYVGRVRVPSLLGHKRLTNGGERGVSRNSDYTPVKTFAKKVRGVLFETFMLPPWLHEKLGLIFDCDSYTINGVSFQATEGYADPTYITRFKLANSSIKLEQLNWMKGYNSHDIGSVDEGGFLITEQGFLKL